MGLLTRKSKLEQLMGAMSGNEMLKQAARSTVQSALDPPAAPAAAPGAIDLGKAAVPIRKAGKPALLAAGGVAGITAASAAISARRRHRSSGE